MERSILHAERVRGRLSVWLPARGVRKAEAVLDTAVRLLGMQLELAHPGAEELLTVAEAAGALVHAVNNHLNSMVLQAACLQVRLEGDARQHTETIRREGSAAAAHLRPIQSVRPWQAADGETADLVAAVHSVLAAWPDLANRTDLDPMTGSVAVAASEVGLRRLVWLLLRIAQRCLPKGRVRLGIEEGGLLLLLPGAQAEEGEGWQRLPPETEAGSLALEREAAAWLVRQFGAVCEVQPTTDALSLHIRWPATR